jgi:malate synthase
MHCPGRCRFRQVSAGFGAIYAAFAPRNAALLAKRDDLQARIDAWHRAHAGRAHDAAAYRNFLSEIGYLVPEPAPFRVNTANVDAELADARGSATRRAGVNARFAINAANARWGSPVRRALRHRCNSRCAAR